MGNKGNTIVEISLVMPIVFGVVVMVLFLFLDTVQDARIQQEGYSVIYTYQTGDAIETETWEEEKLEKHEITLRKEGHVFVTETDVCSNRLRRWQVYGNIVWE